MKALRNLQTKQRRGKGGEKQESREDAAEGNFHWMREGEGGENEFGRDWRLTVARRERGTRSRQNDTGTSRREGGNHNGILNLNGGKEGTRKMAVRRSKEEEGRYCEEIQSEWDEGRGADMRDEW